MIDKEVLKQMGFRKSDDPKWDHEVWYHDSEAWVHYGNNQEFSRYSAYGSNHVCFNGDTNEILFFFKEFVENVKEGARWSALPMTEEW